MDFGTRLSEERKRIGLNQTAFGKIGGVTKTSQLNYEAGERSPNVDYWQAIASAGADVQYILTGVRSANALTTDEQLLLERYRASPQVIKTAALQVVLTGQQGGNTVIHGDVGGRVEAPMHGGSITINMKKESRKSK